MASPSHPFCLHLALRGIFADKLYPCPPKTPLSHNSITELSRHVIHRWEDGPIAAAAAVAKLLQSYLTLCDPIDSSPPGSPVPGILQARILQWVAISVSNACMHAKSLQSCPTLCNPMESSPPGFSVHGML